MWEMGKIYNKEVHRNLFERLNVLTKNKSGVTWHPRAEHIKIQLLSSMTPHISLLQSALMLSEMS
jgi:hypothetical protein